MDTSISMFLGVLFLALGFLGVFLMFRIYGYPFDAERKVSTAPPSLVLAHRIIGLVFVLIYLVMMFQMVPRLFHYQVELPARTVAHLLLGVSVGFLLMIKLLVLRLCPHFRFLLPYLGLGILWCTVLLISLSAPFAYREAYWSQTAVGGSVYSKANLERIRQLLPSAGFPADAPVHELGSKSSLKNGRQVLLTRCVTCHDLKTILTKPRTPSNWVRTVERMAARPIFGNPIAPPEQWAVASYLIAISPDLQISAKHRRVQSLEAAESKKTLLTAISTTVEASAVGTYEVGPSQQLFVDSCTQCHELDEVEQYPMQSASDVGELLTRMVDNGLEVSATELDQIAWYLKQTYVQR
jgi:mono/diheme cytochrome c family protein